MSSLSAAIFVNININPVSAKDSSHSSGGDSNATGNGDIVSSNGSNGDGGSSGKATTTSSADQENTCLSTTNLAGTSNNGSPLTPQQQQPDSSNCNTKLMIECGGFKPNNITTTTPTSQQQQPDSSNCNTKLMIGCVNGGSVQCIVAPCGPSSTTPTNAGDSGKGSTTGGQIVCITAPCGTTTTNPTNASTLTPQQQYQQCAMGIGGTIPGNCTPPPATITEQNRPLQTLNPQQTCQDGSTPSANGVCTSPTSETQGAPVTPVCPENQILSSKGHCIIKPGGIISLPKDTYAIDLGGGRFQLAALPLPSDRNTCGSEFQLYSNYCVWKKSVCPPGTAQDEDDITCSPVKQTKQVEVPANSDGSCPVGAYSVGSSGNAGQPGTGSIICLKNVSAETTPPATSPTNTSPYMPPPSVK
ncbi:MAG: hypothetical protein ACTHKF_09115 [Candidatus Nitrosocosmicus sp.]